MANLSDFLTNTGSAVETAYFQDIRANGVNGQSISTSSTILEFNTEMINKDFITQTSSTQFEPDEGSYVVGIVLELAAMSTTRVSQVWVRDTLGDFYGGVRATSDDPANDASLRFKHSFPLKPVPSGRILEVVIESEESASQFALNPQNGADEFYQIVSFTKVG